MPNYENIIAYQKTADYVRLYTVSVWSIVIDQHDYMDVMVCPQADASSDIGRYDPSLASGVI